MKHHGFIRVLLSFSIVYMSWISCAYAEESEIQLLRKEVRELSKEVKQLNQVVEKQNQRIDQLTQQQAASQPPLKQQKPRDYPTEPKTVETLQTTKEAPATVEPKTQGVAEIEAKAAPPATAETSKSGDQEVESLLNTVNNAPPLPGSQSRSVGLWKYPTGSSTAAKLLPDISVIGSFAGAFFTKEPRGNVDPNPNRTGFTFQELELALQGTVDPYFKYDAFLSFDENGVSVEEAYFSTLAGPPRGLSFRGGDFFLPFGRQNQKHLHAWAFADNNLVNEDFFGFDNLSELGLEAAYLFPTPFFMQLQGTFTNSGGDASFGGSNKGEFLYNGRLSSSVDITNDLTALVGASGAFGFNDTGDQMGNHTTLYGGDFLLKWKHSAYTSLVWQTEYMLRQKQYPNATVTDGGLYSYIDYQFFKQFHAGLRYDQMGIPSGVFNNEWRLTPAFTFNPTEFSQIRLQYELDKRQGFSANQAAILQLMFSLGVHGAHLF
jgi:hypothetical protein